ncbi:ParA family protein [Kitasatospora purpeofusca]|uniref:ParA family protein n=2 Tax=Kitasatospora purpeofusca TaxID=67352 RepID=UPI0035DC928F
MLHQAQPHPRSIMVSTGKGGTGKSTVAAHLAGHCAATGERTLLVCVTTQEDDDLGIAFGHGRSQGAQELRNGMSLYRSVVHGEPLEPVRDVRPGLDVVPGGDGVTKLLRVLLGQQAGLEPQANLHAVQSLARSLAPIAADYDRIVFDTAPENEPLEQLAGSAAAWLIMPTRSDSSSVLGLRRINRNLQIVRNQANGLLRTGAAFLYGSDSRSTIVHSDVKRRIQQLLGSGVPVLSTVVGYREKAAVYAREHGLLFGEIDPYQGHQRNHCSPDGKPREHCSAPQNITALAEDMHMLVREILQYCK